MVQGSGSTPEQGPMLQVVAAVNYMRMKLYAIRIGNKLDDNVYTELVLSRAPISIGHESLEYLLGISVDPDNPYAEFVISVEQAHVKVNPFTEEENEEMTSILRAIGQ